MAAVPSADCTRIGDSVTGRGPMLLSVGDALITGRSTSATLA